MAHDHNCFQAAFDSYREMSLAEDRVGFFLFVAPNDGDRKDDHHFKGNTAFGGVVLRALVASVTKGHEPNGCAHCDRVALALKAADDAFARAMTGAGIC